MLSYLIPKGSRDRQKDSNLREWPLGSVSTTHAKSAEQGFGLGHAQTRTRATCPGRKAPQWMGLGLGFGMFPKPQGMANVSLSTAKK
jgi:hypothetical protein